MSILFGHYVADEGSIEVFGQPLPPGQPRAALAAGIGMVHQHFTLADNLTVLDNVLLGSEPLWQPFSRRSEARAKLLAVSQQFGLPVSPDAKVGSLSVGERQRVEILKALCTGAPASSSWTNPPPCSPRRRARHCSTPSPRWWRRACPSSSSATSWARCCAYRTAWPCCARASWWPRRLRRAPRRGNWRNGWWATPSKLPSAAPHKNVGEPICTLTNVSTAPTGRDRLNNVSLTLRAGEIVAIAGVSGNGQVALADLLCGVRAATTGQVTLRGAPLQARPAWLVSQGVARIPEDRHAVGVVGDLPVWENAVAERLRGPWFAHPWWRAFWVKRRAARQHAQRVAETFDVRGGGPDAPARSLSGGNMQKLILGRALMPPQDAAGMRATQRPQPRNSSSWPTSRPGGWTLAR